MVLPKDPPKDEIRRYLGVSEKADEKTEQLIEILWEKLVATALPKVLWRLCRMEKTLDSVKLQPVLENDNQAKQTATQFVSNDLTQHFCGCQDTYLIAMTLGVSVDNLQRRYDATDILQAMVLDACATAALENLFDSIKDSIRQDFSTHLNAVDGDAVFLTNRFAPGYGDFILENQRKILELLDAPKRIGLTCNEQFLLIPKKSLTCLVGVSDKPEGEKKHSCIVCPMRDRCAFRREG